MSRLSSTEASLAWITALPDLFSKTTPTPHKQRWSS